MQHNRRQFLTRVATGLSAPLILGAQNKSGSAKPVVGTGDHTYEVTHDWGELPPGIKYGNTHGVCEDAQGHIYIHHTVNKISESHDSMVVFDAEGKFVKSWGAEFEGGAHGLHIHQEESQEFLYLCDTQRGVVVKATLNGETVWSIGYPEESEAYKPIDGQKIKYSPTNLAIAPNGDIYVGDGYGSSYINQYTKDAKYIRTFGGKGKEAGKLNCPHGILVDLREGKPNLIVADRGNARLQRFTLDGEHIDFIAGTKLPCNFGFFKNGDVVVPDLGARVTLLDKNNQVIDHLGDDSATRITTDKGPQAEWRTLRTQARTEFKPGKFVCPHGACFDHHGNVFVVEWVEVGRVSKLRKA